MRAAYPPSLLGSRVIHLASSILHVVKFPIIISILPSGIVTDTPSSLRSSKLRNFTLTEVFKKVTKIGSNDVFWHARWIFRCGNESTVRRRWRKNTAVITHAAGRSCGGLSGSSVLEFRFQLDPFVYTCSWLYVHSVSTSAKFDLHQALRNVKCCVGRGVPVHSS
jgi:hypothetical protein